jgi:hypothetical protein
MKPDTSARAEERFWTVAEALLDQPGVTRSTMMGLPCLRRAGAFFASYDRRTGNLVIKLAEARVTDLIDAGTAEPFAPAGRRFRQWAAIPPTAANTWAALVAEAHSFATGT